MHAYTQQVHDLIGEVRSALDDTDREQFDNLVARRAQSMQPEDAVPALAAVRGYLRDWTGSSSPSSAGDARDTAAATPDERRVWREQFLASLYELSEADLTRRFAAPQVGHVIGLEGDDLRAMVRYLGESGLVSFATLPGSPDVIGPISITRAGIDAAEGARPREVFDGDGTFAWGQEQLQPLEQREVEAVLGRVVRAWDAEQIQIAGDDDKCLHALRRGGVRLTRYVGC